MYAILAQQTERTRGSSTSQIKQLIAESDSKIILLENEMAALESRMAALVELRDLECAARDALRFLTAPIRTLPVELLAEIFLLSIREPDESGYIYSKLLHIQDAFRISHVCRRWRQIANGTPQLWAGPVKVDFRQQRSLTEEGINGLEMLLARSAPLTVPVTIIGLENGSRPTESSCRATETLLCTAARWRSLRFVNYMVPPWFFQRLAGRSLDCLEELVLWNVDQDSHFDPTTVSSFATAPRLRKATLSSTCGIPMPWAQLRDITLAERISPESFRSIFSQCIDVLKVCVRVVGTSVLSQIRPDALALNQLRILSVTWVGDESGMQFFDCLSAPALDELHLCFEEGDIDWAEDAFTAFQLRSPNITKLKIEGEGFPVPSHALITAFRHAPFLTHFSIDHCPNSVDDHFCQALCYTDDAEPLVPRLHTLAVAETDGKFSQDGLANMIASRWWTDTELASRSRPPAVARWKQIRLKEDWIGSSFEFSSTFRGTIYALQETGLDFDFVELEYWKLDW
ncbi:F-box domain-containing protein [Mycena sanguinolenta]|uniref:F-box domain-containing protein n=1 Tax=Mycena sanguinolenta TaxID=230812 RepID=A0A8H6YEC7_9AGAR|nr:F-box domain-containing protein [Mycena sanguinolenta]